MTTESKKPAPGPHENLGIFALILAAVYRIGRRIAFRLAALWHVYPILLVFAASLLLAAVGVLIWGIFRNRRIVRDEEARITAPDPTSVYLGKSAQGEQLHLARRFRIAHTQVIGTTNAGKTESVILPWAIRDLETKAGMLIIDGKSDRSFIEKFYAYVVKSRRKSHFRLFSLASPEHSATFNPLVGGTPYEITERVFSAFKFEDEYYKVIQYQIFHALIRLIIGVGEVPTFVLIRQLLRSPELLAAWVERTEDHALREELGPFLSLGEAERSKRTSGLDAHLAHFTSGELGCLFNATDPTIRMDEMLAEGQVCYFQLPSMMFHELAAATGKLVLQAFQSAVARRHLGLDSKDSFFSCYLDDFQDYIYEGFGSLLNKSRSANIGVVFSHQSLGDLEKVSPAFKQIVLTNTNIKCVMRSNDPATCEHFAASFGTATTEKLTERQQTGLLGATKTGEGSVRAVEEFIVHPNDIRALGTGEGIVSIPHYTGVKTVRLRFARRPDIAPIALPVVPKVSTAQLSSRKDAASSESQQNRVDPKELNATKSEGVHEKAS